MSWKSSTIAFSMKFRKEPRIKRRRIFSTIEKSPISSKNSKNPNGLSITISSPLSGSVKTSICSKTNSCKKMPKSKYSKNMQKEPKNNMKLCQLNPKLSEIHSKLTQFRSFPNSPSRAAPSHPSQTSATTKKSCKNSPNPIIHNFILPNLNRTANYLVSPNKCTLILRRVVKEDQSIIMPIWTFLIIATILRPSFTLLPVTLQHPPTITQLCHNFLTHLANRVTLMHCNMKKIIKICSRCINLTRMILKTQCHKKISLSINQMPVDTIRTFLLDFRIIHRLTIKCLKCLYWGLEKFQSRKWSTRIGCCLKNQSHKSF